MIILRQVLISIAAALLIWRIGVVGMSSHYAQSIIAGERDAVDKALTWDKRQPEALYRQALALRDDDPDTAATLLAQANAYYMADARPFFVAAEAALTQGDPTRADALKDATEIETVQQFYSLRRESRQAPITLSERKNYVARLIKDGLIAQAYRAWFNGLTYDQRKRLGLLYDGSFEFEPANWGFDWHLHPHRDALIERVYTYGSDGSKSLHIRFNHYQGHFSGSLYQRLFLDAGSYRLRGRVHTDSLDTRGGLKWVIRCLLPAACCLLPAACCLLPEPEELGESERFLGANEWRDFRFEFQVPEACSLQEIHLVSAEKHPHEHWIIGDAWFDRMAIHKMNDE